MMDLRILPEVADDLSEAASWYDEEGYAGLGDRFIAIFYAYVSHLQQSGELVVSLVIHAARNPERAQTLLRSRRH